MLHSASIKRLGMKLRGDSRSGDSRIYESSLYFKIFMPHYSPMKKLMQIFNYLMATVLYCSPVQGRVWSHVPVVLVNVDVILKKGPTFKLGTSAVNAEAKHGNHLEIWWHGVTSCWRRSSLEQTLATDGDTRSAAVLLYNVAFEWDLIGINVPMGL